MAYPTASQMCIWGRSVSNGKNIQGINRNHHINMKLAHKYIMSSKLILDNVHKYIRVSHLARMIIDTPEFQRMREIKQLGACHYVFPGANHNRYQHSLGVYYLTGKMLHNLKRNSDPAEVALNIPELGGEVELDDRVIELVKIAGLCHDLGHGPFSHAFDDAFLGPKTESKFKEHEERSAYLVEYLVKKYVNVKEEVISDLEIQFIKNIIEPQEGHHGYIYQIVANNLNSIDVDKFDYIVRDSQLTGLKSGFDCSQILEEVRVIGNTVCYPKQTVLYFHDLFMNRYSLHKKVYQHKTVKCIEYMLYDILEEINEDMGILESVENIDDGGVERFCQLTDAGILAWAQFGTNVGVQKILQRLQTRNLYKCVGELILNLNTIRAYDHVLNKELFCQQVDGLEEDDIIISISKVGFVSGNKDNPLDSIYFYDKKETSKCFTIQRSQISNLISDTYQEVLVKVICRSEDCEVINRLQEVMAGLTES